MGEPSVSNCLRPSAVPRTPASLSRRWRVSSKSSMEPLYGTSIWRVNEVGVRAMIVAFMVPAPQVRAGSYHDDSTWAYIIPRSNPLYSYGEKQGEAKSFRLTDVADL